jgi:hypothetical protein
VEGVQIIPLLGEKEWTHVNKFSPAVGQKLGRRSNHGPIIRSE